MVKPRKCVIKKKYSAKEIVQSNIIGHLPKSQKSHLLITVKLTSIKRLPPLTGRGHLFLGPNKT